jgi:hypothetical protein
MDDPASVLIVIAVWLIGSIMVSGYASNKGLNSFPYFIASIFLSPAIGFIAAAAAQPKPPDAPIVPIKKCPDCAEMVLADARKCRFCGLVFGESV